MMVGFLGTILKQASPKQLSLENLEGMAVGKGVLGYLVEQHSIGNGGGPECLYMEKL